MSEIKEISTDFAVLGGGPGGYTAAFRAADLGLSVVLIEKEEKLGGVCLNVGCIPSKTLLHAAEVLREAASAESFGISFAAPNIDLDTLRMHKEGVVNTLTTGLAKLAKARKITVMYGTGSFTDAHTISVTFGEDEITNIIFSHAVIATGSSTVRIPGLDYTDKRIWDSTDALSLKNIPERLLVIGGGIIGLEMAAVYHELGSAVTIVEMMDQLIPLADADVVRPLMQVLRKRYKGIFIETRVKSVDQSGSVLKVFLQGKKAPEVVEADVVLVSVGRRPNTQGLGAEDIGIKIDNKGFFATDETKRTSVEHIFAIGDAVGNPMLAHKAVHEGKVAAESAAGLPSAFTPLTIPSVAYTDPEVAWMGLTEKEAAAENIAYEKGIFPWSASGRALSSGGGGGRGISKALFDPETGRLIGAGITGRNAGELIAEAVLALEMGADAEDISRTIHAHPTLAETFAGAAEMYLGSITDLLPPKRQK
ncbi:MAG: dihydrolipoyl dehydrogenase [Bacteroidetes bacterium]|nr:dihydrolipoyl dehydrogenase [Bacteroidota bacterium]